MNPKDKKTMNRRAFVKSVAIAIVATNCLGMGLKETTAHSRDAMPDTVDLLMKAASSHSSEIKKRLQVISADISALRNIKVPKDLFTPEECADVANLMTEKDRLFAMMLDEELKNVGIESDLRKLEELVDAMAGSLEQKRKMTSEIKTAFIKSHELIVEARVTSIARGIFIRIAKEHAHAARLLEAIRTKNRSAIEEMLKRDVPGSNVVVQDTKEDNGILLNVRIGAFSHCLSTSEQCNGKQFAVTKSR